MEQLRGVYGGRPVLVVGADGFLGVNCVQALRDLGAEVTALSRRTVSPAGFFADHVVHGDMTDPEAVSAAVQGQELVFDFAGVSTPVRSNLAGVSGLNEECAPHLTLFTACVQCSPPPRVIFCSSRLVYGQPQYLPVDERHPLAPSCFYGAHKVLLEHYLLVLSRVSGLEFTIIRLSNPYGMSGTSMSTGQSVVNLFIDRARRGEALTVYGDGRQLRDYILVGDAIDAMLRSAVTPACRNDVFNLGSGHPISLRDAADLIVQRFGGRVQTVPWPGDYLSTETGDYHTDLGKLRRVVELPALRTFEQGLGLVQMKFRDDVPTT